MKPYIKYTIKRYLPYFLTLGIILVAYFMICINVSNAVVRTSSSFYIFNRPTSSMLGFFIPLIILTTFAPLFVNRYRYHIQDVDLFYQNPKGQRSIRYVNNLVVLIGSVIIYTGLFLLSLLIMFLTELPNAGKVVTSGDITYSYFVFNFGYYILAYILFLIAGCLNYFIAYFLVTRSNRLINSLIMLACGYFLLNNALTTPLYYVIHYIRAFSSTRGYAFNISNLNVFHSITMVNPLAIVYQIFNPLVIDMESSYFDSKEALLLVLDFVYLGLYIALGIICLLVFIKEKESSGEFAGKPMGRDYGQKIIFEASFIVLAFMLGATTNNASSILALVIVLHVAVITFLSAGHYIFNGIMNHRFSIKKKDIIPYVIIVSTYLVSVVLTTVLNAVLSNIK